MLVSMYVKSSYILASVARRTVCNNPKQHKHQKYKMTQRYSTVYPSITIKYFVTVIVKDK